MGNDLSIEQNVMPTGIEMGLSPQLVDHVILEDYPSAIDYSPYRQPNTSGLVNHLFLYRMGNTEYVVKVWGDRSLSAPSSVDIADLETRIRNYETARVGEREANRNLADFKASLNGSAQQRDRVLRAVTRQGADVDDITITDGSVRSQLILLGKYHLIKEIQKEADGVATSDQETPTQVNVENNSTGISKLLRKFLG